MTRSAISPATIEVTDEGNQKQDLALLNRDTRGLNGTVSQIPDLQQLLSEQSDTMAAGDAISRAMDLSNDTPNVGKSLTVGGVAGVAVPFFLPLHN